MSRVPHPAVLLAASLLACAEPNPGLTPPGLPGAVENDKDVRLFFPIGLDVSKDGSLIYVANTNFDRAFNGGTLVSIKTATFDQVAQQPDKRDQVPADSPVARLDSFGGELKVNPDATALYVTTRDNDSLTKVPLDANGAFSCDPVKGCSANAVPLGPQSMDDPFAVAFGQVQLPGGTAPEPVVFVSHLTPQSSGQQAEAKHAFAAVIPERVATASDQPFSNGAFLVDLGVPASDSLVFDPTASRLFVGGCFIRVSAESVVPCSANPDSSFFRLNPLRSVFPGAGAGAPVEQINLGNITGGGDTVTIDTSSDGKFLYVMTARPSALLVIEKPVSASEPVVVRNVVPLAATASRMLVLRRPTGDIVVASAQQANAVLVVDPNVGQVLAQLAPVGKGPYELATHPVTGADRVYVGLFNDCGVTAIDIPTDRPFAASIVSTVGECKCTTGTLNTATGSCQ